MGVDAVSGSISNLVQQTGAVPGNQIQPEEPKVEVASTQDLQTESGSSTENSSADGNSSVPSEGAAASGQGGDVDVLA